jgi:hypothetical protein
VYSPREKYCTFSDFMNILETVSQELSYFPGEIYLSLRYASCLPIADNTHGFKAIPGNHSTTLRYWIPWTEELGAWISEDGSQVEIVVRETCEEGEISGSLTLGLTSVITGACLNLQNQVAIHANAISLQGKAVAFVGYSGQGKSTLSAYCASQGAGFVTDDVLIADADNLVYPGNPRIKLYPYTGQSLGLEATEETDYKIFYEPEQLGAKLNQQPVPLGIIYLLAESSDHRIYSEKLSASHAIFELLTHSYYASALIPENPALLDAYLRLVRQTSVKKLYYPRDFELLPNVYGYLLQEIDEL